MLENSGESVDKTESKVVEVVNETLKVEVEEIVDKADDTVDAVEEIENSIAVEAEKDTAKEDESAVVDYSKLSLDDLVAELKNTLSNNPVQKIKNQVEELDDCIAFEVQVTLQFRLQLATICMKLPHFNIVI